MSSTEEGLAEKIDDVLIRLDVSLMRALVGQASNEDITKGQALNQIIHIFKVHQAVEYSRIKESNHDELLGTFDFDGIARDVLDRAETLKSLVSKEE